MDKERIQGFKTKIRELEAELEKARDQLDQYQATNGASDDKIKGLNAMHQEKIQSLMNSINLLQKENQTLKKANKDHKRSELIENLNKEIAEQDTIIDVLRKLLNDDKKADSAIVAELSKGPPRFRQESREELKAKIKKLDVQASSAVKLKKDYEEVKRLYEALKEETEMRARREKLAKENEMKALNESEKADVYENMINHQEDLKRENDDLKLNLHAQKTIISNYEEELTKKSEEIGELKSIKTDYQTLAKKYEVLQREIANLKKTDNKKHILTFDKEMQLDEMKIMSKLDKDNYNLAEKHLKLEHENLTTRVEELEKETSELSRENERLLTKNDELVKTNLSQKKEIEKKTNELTKLSNERQNEKNKFEKTINELNTDKTRYSDEMTRMKKDLASKKTEIEKLNDEIDECNFRIKQLEKKGDQAEKDKRDLKDQMAEMERTKLTSGPLFEENKFLKSKLKELTVREINLQSRLENLETELQLKKKNQGGIQVQHKLMEKDDKRIEELENKVIDLERRNKELSVLYKDLDSNLNSSFSVIRARQGSSMNSDLSDFEGSLANSSEKNDSQLSNIRTASVVETNSDLPSALIRDDDILKENKQLRGILMDKTKQEINMYEKIRTVEDEIGKYDKTQTKRKPNSTSKDIEQSLNEISQFNKKKFSNLSNRFADLNMKNRELEKSIERMNSSITSLVSKQERSMNFENMDDLDSNLSNF